MTLLPWRPQFDYDISSSWAASIPTRIWQKIRMTTGGADRAATWLGASYVISQTEMLAITIRYLETEENDLFDCIDYLRTWPNTGTFYPDQLIGGTSFEVDVQSPMQGEDLRGREDPDYPEAREIDIVLRNVAGTQWPMNWFS